MAWHNNITTTAWSPLAGGTLSGKYSREDLQDDTTKEGSTRKGNIKAMGQLNERSLAIVDVVKEIAKEVNRTPSINGS